MGGERLATTETDWDAKYSGQASTTELGSEAVNSVTPDGGIDYETRYMNQLKTEGKPYQGGISNQLGVEDYMKFWGAKTRTGVRGPIQGLGRAMQMFEKLTPDQYQQTFSDSAQSDMDARQITNFEKRIGESNWMSIFNPALIVGDLFEAAPQLGLNIATSVGGKVAGSVLGAGGGAAGGAIVGATTAGTPGAILGAAGGAGAGSRLGGETMQLTAPFLVNSALMAGQVYGKLLDHGADHVSARNIAIPVGISQALYEGAGFATLSAIAKKEVARKLSKAAILERVKDFGVAYGVNFATGEGQAISGFAGDNLAARLTDARGIEHDFGDFLDQLGKATRTNIRGQIGGAAGAVMLQRAAKTFHDGAAQAKNLTHNITEDLINERLPKPEDHLTDSGSQLPAKEALAQARITEESLSQSRRAAANDYETKAYATEQKQIAGQDATTEIDAQRQSRLALNYVRDRHKAAVFKLKLAELHNRIAEGGGKGAERIQEVQDDFRVKYEKVVGEDFRSNIEAEIKHWQHKLDKAEYKLHENIVLNRKSAPTKDLENKVGRYRAMVDTYQHIYDQLTKGSGYTLDEITQINKGLKEGSVTNLANRALDAIANAFKDGRSKGVADLKQSQNALKALIKKSGLASSEQVRFLGELTKVKNDADVSKMFDEMAVQIGDVIKKREISKASENLNKQLDKAKPDTSTSAPKSRYDPESNIQETLDAFNYFIKNKDVPYTPKTSMEKAVRDRVQATDFNKISEVKELAKLVEKIADEGLQAMEGKLATQAAKVHKLKLDYRRALQGDKQENHVPEELNAVGGYDQQRPMKQFIRSWATDHLSWLGRFEWVFQDSKNVSEILKALDVNENVQNEQMYTGQEIESLLGSISSHTGLKKTEDVVNLMIRMAADKETAVVESAILQKSNDPNAKPVYKLEKREFTLGGGAQVLAHMGDDSQHNAIQFGNRLTLEGTKAIGDMPSTQEALTAAITVQNPKYLQVISAIKEYYENVYPDLAAAYKAKTGLDLPREFNYAGTAKKLNEKKDAQNDAARFQATLDGRYRTGAEKRSEAPTMTRARVDSDYALDTDVNIITNAFNHAFQSSHFRAWADSNLGEIISDPTNKRVMKRKFGDLEQKRIESHLEQMVNGTPVEVGLKLEYFEKFILRHAAVAKLGGKPLSLIQQLAGLAGVAATMPTADFLHGVVSFFDNPYENAKRITESREWKNRYGSKQGYNTVLAGAVQTADINMLKQAKTDEVAMFLFMIGDKGASILGGHASYMYHRRTKKLENGTEITVNEKEAVTEAMRAVNQTQSSRNINELSDFNRSGKLKSLGFLGGQNERTAEFRTLKWQKFWRRPSPGSAVDAIRTTVVLHGAEAVFKLAPLAWLMYRSTDEKEKQRALSDYLRSVINGPQSNIWNDAIVGAEKLGEKVLIKTFNIAWDNPRFYDWSTIPLTMATKTFEMGITMTNGKPIDDDKLLLMSIQFQEGIGMLLHLFPYAWSAKEIRRELKGGRK